MRGGIDASNPTRSSPADAASRVVVLSPPHGSTPAVLLSALGKKGLSCSVVSDSPAVVAELAAQPAKAVVVCDPQERRSVGDLVHALAVYFPGTLRWGYRSDREGPHLQRLEAFTSDASFPAVEEEQGSHEEQGSPGDAHRGHGGLAGRKGPAFHRDRTAQPTREQASEDRAAGGSFDELASLVEQATEDAGGPRLRLAGGNLESWEGRAASAAPTQRPDAPSQSSRIRATRLRRRLADLVHPATNSNSTAENHPAGVSVSPYVHTPEASTDSDDEPLITREELAMLLGPPETEPAPAPATGTTAGLRIPPHGTAND